MYHSQPGTSRTPGMRVSEVSLSARDPVYHRKNPYLDSSSGSNSDEEDQRLRVRFGSHNTTNMQNNTFDESYNNNPYMFSPVKEARGQSRVDGPIEMPNLHEWEETQLQFNKNRVASMKPSEPRAVPSAIVSSSSNNSHNTIKVVHPVQSMAQDIMYSDPVQYAASFCPLRDAEGHELPLTEYCIGWHDDDFEMIHEMQDLAITATVRIEQSPRRTQKPRVSYSDLLENALYVLPSVLKVEHAYEALQAKPTPNIQSVIYAHHSILSKAGLADEEIMRDYTYLPFLLAIVRHAVPDPSALRLNKSGFRFPQSVQQEQSIYMDATLSVHGQLEAVWCTVSSSRRTAAIYFSSRMMRTHQHAWSRLQQPEAPQPLLIMSGVEIDQEQLRFENDQLLLLNDVDISRNEQQPLYQLQHSRESAPTKTEKQDSKLYEDMVPSEESNSSDSEMSIFITSPRHMSDSRKNSPHQEHGVSSHSGRSRSRFFFTPEKSQIEQKREEMQQVVEEIPTIAEVVSQLVEESPTIADDVQHDLQKLATRQQITSFNPSHEDGNSDGVDITITAAGEDTHEQTVEYISKDIDANYHEYNDVDNIQYLDDFENNDDDNDDQPTNLPAKHSPVLHIIEPPSTSASIQQVHTPQSVLTPAVLMQSQSEVPHEIVSPANQQRIDTQDAVEDVYNTYLASTASVENVIQDEVMPTMLPSVIPALSSDGQLDVGYGNAIMINNNPDYLANTVEHLVSPVYSIPEQLVTSRYQAVDNTNLEAVVITADPLDVFQTEGQDNENMYAYAVDVHQTQCLHGVQQCQDNNRHASQQRKESALNFQEYRANIALRMQRKERTKFFLTRRANAEDKQGVQRVVQALRKWHRRVQVKSTLHSQLKHKRSGSLSSITLKGYLRLWKTRSSEQRKKSEKLMTLQKLHDIKRHKSQMKRAIHSLLTYVQCRYETKCTVIKQVLQKGLLLDALRAMQHIANRRTEQRLSIGQKVYNQAQVRALTSSFHAMRKYTQRRVVLRECIAKDRKREIRQVVSQWRMRTKEQSEHTQRSEAVRLAYLFRQWRNTVQLRKQQEQVGYDLYQRRCLRTQIEVLLAWREAAENNEEQNELGAEQFEKTRLQRQRGVFNTWLLSLARSMHARDARKSHGLQQLVRHVLLSRKERQITAKAESIHRFNALKQGFLALVYNKYTTKAKQDNNIVADTHFLRASCAVPQLRLHAENRKINQSLHMRAEVGKYALITGQAIKKWRRYTTHRKTSKEHLEMAKTQQMHASVRSLFSVTTAQRKLEIAKRSSVNKEEDLLRGVFYEWRLQARAAKARVLLMKRRALHLLHQYRADMQHQKAQGDLLEGRVNGVVMARVLVAWRGAARARVKEQQSKVKALLVMQRVVSHAQARDALHSWRLRTRVLDTRVRARFDAWYSLQVNSRKERAYCLITAVKQLRQHWEARSDSKVFQRMAEQSHYKHTALKGIQALILHQRKQTSKLREQSIQHERVRLLQRGLEGQRRGVTTKHITNQAQLFLTAAVTERQTAVGETNRILWEHRDRILRSSVRSWVHETRVQKQLTDKERAVVQRKCQQVVLPAWRWYTQTKLRSQTMHTTAAAHLRQQCSIKVLEALVQQANTARLNAADAVEDRITVFQVRWNRIKAKQAVEVLANTVRQNTAIGNLAQSVQHQALSSSFKSWAVLAAIGTYATKHYMRNSLQKVFNVWKDTTTQHTNQTTLSEHIISRNHRRVTLTVFSAWRDKALKQRSLRTSAIQYLIGKQQRQYQRRQVLQAVQRFLQSHKITESPVILHALVSACVYGGDSRVLSQCSARTLEQCLAELLGSDPQYSTMLSACCGVVVSGRASIKIRDTNRHLHLHYVDHFNMSEILKTELKNVLASISGYSTHTYAFIEQESPFVSEVTSIMNLSAFNDSQLTVAVEDEDESLQMHNSKVHQPMLFTTTYNTLIPYVKEDNFIDMNLSSHSLTIVNNTYNSPDDEELVVFDNNSLQTHSFYAWLQHTRRIRQQKEHLREIQLRNAVHALQIKCSIKQSLRMDKAEKLHQLVQFRREQAVHHLRSHQLSSQYRQKCQQSARSFLLAPGLDAQKYNWLHQRRMQATADTHFAKKTLAYVFSTMMYLSGLSKVNRDKAGEFQLLLERNRKKDAVNRLFRLHQNRNYLRLQMKQADDMLTGNICRRGGDVLRVWNELTVTDSKLERTALIVEKFRLRQYLQKWNIHAENAQVLLVQGELAMRRSALAQQTLTSNKNDMHRNRQLKNLIQSNQAPLYLFRLKHAITRQKLFGCGSAMYKRTEEHHAMMYNSKLTRDAWSTLRYHFLRSQGHHITDNAMEGQADRHRLRRVWGYMKQVYAQKQADQKKLYGTLQYMRDEVRAKQHFAKSMPGGVKTAFREVCESMRQRTLEIAFASKQQDKVKSDALVSWKHSLHMQREEKAEAQRASKIDTVQYWKEYTLKRIDDRSNSATAVKKTVDRNIMGTVFHSWKCKLQQRREHVSRLELQAAEHYAYRLRNESREAVAKLHSYAVDRLSMKEKSRRITQSLDHGVLTHVFSQWRRRYLNIQCAEELILERMKQRRSVSQALRIQFNGEHDVDDDKKNDIDHDQYDDMHVYVDKERIQLSSIPNSVLYTSADSDSSDNEKNDDDNIRAPSSGLIPASYSENLVPVLMPSIPNNTLSSIAFDNIEPAEQDPLTGIANRVTSAYLPPSSSSHNTPSKSPSSFSEEEDLEHLDLIDDFSDSNDDTYNPQLMEQRHVKPTLQSTRKKELQPEASHPSTALSSSPEQSSLSILKQQPHNGISALRRRMHVPPATLPHPEHPTHRRKVLQIPKTSSNPARSSRALKPALHSQVTIPKDIELSKNKHMTPSSAHIESIVIAANTKASILAKNM